MLKKYIKFAPVLVLILVFLLVLKYGIGAEKSEKNNFNQGEISVILSGFGSRDLLGRWQGETAPFMDLLSSARNVSGEVAMCENSYEGYLYGNRVLVASSGMAKVKTTACLLDILQNYDVKIKEVIFVGIAGITPMKGGMKDESGHLRNSEPAMLGDVCINSLSFDFDLQHYSSDYVDSDLLTPLYWSQKSNFASQYQIADSDLAQELYSASSKVVWPNVPQTVKEINDLYHGKNRGPKVWNLNECVEATSDLYWHDTYSDERAREMAAIYLNQANNTSLKFTDVLIVTSMEAAPSGLVVEWWNEINNTNISFAYVRGASNFDHPNLNSELKPALSGHESVDRFKNSGSSQYAIETAALPVLKMFELRSPK